MMRSRPGKHRASNALRRDRVGQEVRYVVRKRAGKT
jgi:hypothetical protein